MLKDSRRKRHKFGLLFSRRKQLDKLKMLRRLSKANGAKMNSIIWTLFYENHEVKVGHFQYRNSLTQCSDGTNIAKLDSVDRNKEDGRQSSVPKSNTLLRSSELVNSTM